MFIKKATSDEWQERMRKKKRKKEWKKWETHKQKDKSRKAVRRERETDWMRANGWEICWKWGWKERFGFSINFYEATAREWISEEKSKEYFAENVKYYTSTNLTQPNLCLMGASGALLSNSLQEQASGPPSAKWPFSFSFLSQGNRATQFTKSLFSKYSSNWDFA